MEDWERELIDTARTVRRTFRWTGRTIATIETRNPVYGWLTRGRIERTRTADGWAWVAADQDRYEVYRGAGDYLDAESALMAATTWADDTTPTDHREDHA